MALNQTNKLVWIVETIHHAKKISFEDLNNRWKENVELSGGLDIVKRTFHKWKIIIFETFGIIIDCEKVAPYRYFIANEEDMRSGNFENWLLKTYAVCNSLVESKSIRERILLEDLPSGRDHLQPIIEAMKQNRFLHIIYNSYWQDAPQEYYIMPLCIKLFRQRWYMVGRIWPVMGDRIFCLDRIRSLRYSHHTFDFPDDFSPEEYFSGCFGIINDRDCAVETVKLKVSASQANYLRDLPLHESQREVERGTEHSIFTVRVRPTFDFQQELLWNREELEVLEPAWLRKEIAGTIKKMGKLYHSR